MNNGVNSDNNEVKTFTQEEVNKLVSERVARVKSDKEQEYNAKLAELTQKELHLKAREVLSNKGLPDGLLDIVSCPDIETFTNNINTLMSYIRAFKPVESFIPGNGMPPEYPNSASDNSMREAFGLSAYIDKR